MSVPYLPDLSFKADTRVVLVGTTRCPLDETYLPELPQVAHNIRRLKRLLTHPGLVGLPEEAVVTLLDLKESSEISTRIKEAADAATDTLIIYYAGHGLLGDTWNPLYLAAGNTTVHNQIYNAVPISNVQRAMRGSQASKRILILDCCYGGRALHGLMSAEQAVASIDVDGTFGIAADVGGTFGVAAASDHERAYAPPGEELTRFTGALVEVLEHGVEGNQTVLTLVEVFRQVEARIRRHGDAPLPCKVNMNNAESFRLARNRVISPSGSMPHIVTDDAVGGSKDAPQPKRIERKLKAATIPPSSQRVDRIPLDALFICLVATSISGIYCSSRLVTAHITDTVVSGMIMETCGFLVPFTARILLRKSVSKNNYVNFVDGVLAGSLSGAVSIFFLMYSGYRSNAVLIVTNYMATIFSFVVLTGISTLVGSIVIERRASGESWLLSLADPRFVFLYPVALIIYILLMVQEFNRPDYV